MKKRVITFQSKEVLDIVKEKGIYTVDVTRCREYYNDVAKVWCFDINDKTIEDFYSGELFDRFRCEMSLSEEPGLTAFVMLELVVDEERLSWCDAHNAYDRALVFDTLFLNDIIAVYEVRYTAYFFYKQIVVKEIMDTHCLFPNGLDMFYTGVWHRYCKKYKIEDPAESLRVAMFSQHKWMPEVIASLLYNSMKYIYDECDTIDERIERAEEEGLSYVPMIPGEQVLLTEKQKIRLMSIFKL